MKYRTIFAALLLGTLAVPVLGQQPFIPYQSRPAISPWFEMFRKDAGPLPNYLQYVRPRQQLQGALQQQRVNQSELQSHIRGLTGQLESLQSAGVQVPTGTGSTFMNHSHYYPNMRAAAGRRR